MTASHQPSPSRHECASASGEVQRLSQRFDGVERQVLDLMRLSFSRRAGAVPRFAANPSDVARDLFGPHEGARVLQAVLDVVQQMSLARRDTFHYTNPYCQGCAERLTPEEGHLLQIVKDLRQNRRGAAIISALMICEAEPVEALITAGEVLAALLPRYH